MASTNSTVKLMKAVLNGVWQHDNPLNFSVPLIIIQICLVLVVTRTLAFLFKPLRQPRVIAEIIGGILLGPTGLGRNHLYMNSLFPKQSISVLDTFANIGLLFFLFVVGLELDLKALRTVGTRALSIAAAGIGLPFAAGAGVAVVIHQRISKGVHFAPFLLFMGVAMSITAFPVLARILAELKLLTTDVGHTAMSAAAVNDVTAWILLALAVATSGSGSWTVSLWMLFSGAGFVVFMFIVVKRLLTWMVRQTEVNGEIKEIHVCITLGLVLLSGFATDAIGIHVIFGGFILGLLVPKEGPFAQSLIEKLEDFISVLLLPLYFASSGLKTNIGAIHGVQSWGLFVLVLAVACLGKIAGTSVTAQIFTRNFRQSLTLGVLMNTKGLVELIVLNIGKDRGVLNDEIFAIMVLMALVTTFITTPIVVTIYHPARKLAPYSIRKIYNEKASSNDNLRILSCVHGIRDLPAMINLTETVRGQTRGKLRLYILHLMELSERSSAIMMVQRARRDGRPFWNDSDKTGEGRIDPIVVGYEAFGQLSEVKMRAMTAISRFEDIHEDICSTAQEKRAAIIILPFHKHVRIDGSFETRRSEFEDVNRRVLQSAPCSVGILIDRGFSGNTQIAPENVRHTAIVLFFGGADDREALALGLRMAEHPGVQLSILRYTGGLVPSEVNEQSSPTTDLTAILDSTDNKGSSSQSTFIEIPDDGPSHFTAENLDAGSEGQLDEDFLTSIRQGTMSIAYEEMEIIELTESLIVDECKVNDFDLVLIGSGRHPSPLLRSLVGRGDSTSHVSELGPVGVLLTSSRCSASILVVQGMTQSLQAPKSL